MMTNFLDRLSRTARHRWLSPAVSDLDGQTLTHQMLYSRVRSIGQMLRMAGLEPGDRVAITGKGSSVWLASFLAILHEGLVAVPMLEGFTPDMVAGILRHSAARVLLAPARLFQGLDQDRPEGLRAVVDVEQGRVLYLCEALRSLEPSLRECLSRGQDPGLRPEDVDYTASGLEDLALVNYTSGTTGLPKGVTVTVGAISMNVDYCAAHIPFREGDAVLSVLPPAHMYGLSVELLFNLCQGAHVVFLGRQPSPSVLASAYLRVRPYMVVWVPMIVEKMVQTSVLPRLRRPLASFLIRLPLLRRLVCAPVRRRIMTFLGGKVRLITIGGAALSPEVETVLRNCRLPFSVGYGMTEAAPLIGYADPWNYQRGSCGRPVDGMRVRIDSPDPGRVPGEILIRGPQVTRGYLDNEAATREALTPDGWLRTGDLGLMDARGNLFIRGRLKCMILSSSGQNIYPEEIEERLNILEGVQESLVLERGGALVALVALSQDVGVLDSESSERTARQILSQANRHLPSYSRLSRVEILPGGFEHTPKNTVLRSRYH